jgi:hypothetical protein
MKINGGCHCGNIKYTAEIDPQKVILCHCSDCQQMSGAAFRGVLPSTDTTFSMTGNIKDYIKETADSGMPRAQGFCPECGTHIYATAVGDMPAGTKPYMIRLGTVEQKDDINPTVEIWCDSRQSWLDPIEGATQVSKQPG